MKKQVKTLYFKRRMRYNKSIEIVKQESEVTKMTDPKKYFEKNGFIYGDSYKFEFGKWSHHITKFESWKEAQEWLHTEEEDFREREFITATEAKKHGYKDQCYSMR